MKGNTSYVYRERYVVSSSSPGSESNRNEFSISFSGSLYPSNLNLVDVKWLFDVGTIWQEPHERGGSVSLCLFLFRLHDIHNIDFMCFWVLEWISGCSSGKLSNDIVSEGR